MHSEWDAYSGLVGAGGRFDLGSGLHLEPMVNASLAYLVNEGSYSGPGAAVTAALLDGIFFNYRATDFIYGGALRLEHEHDLGDREALTSVARYDLRWAETIQSTDPAQDGEELVQRVILRSEYSSPTGLEPFAAALEWRANLGYVRFLGDTDELLGFTDYFELGLALDSGVPRAVLGETVPEDSTLSFAAAVTIGADIRGWTIGASVSF